MKKEKEEIMIMPVFSDLIQTNEGEIICGAEEDYLKDCVMESFIRQENEEKEAKEYLINFRTLEKSVDTKLHEFDDFNLSDRAELEKLIRLRLQSQNLKTVCNNKMIACNVIVECDEVERACDFADRLQSVLEYHNQLRVEEPDPSLQYEDDFDALYDAIIEGCEFIVVNACHERPDGIYERAPLQTYDRFWKAVENVGTLRPDVMLVIITSPEIMKNTISKNRNLHDIIAPHHMKLNGFTEEQIFKICLAGFEKCGFVTDRVFKRELRRFVMSTYQCSAFRGRRFVDYVVNAVTVNFYSEKIRCDARLTTDALPDCKIFGRKEAFKELDDMIGLKTIKKRLKSIILEVNYAKMLKEEGIELDSYERHMLFTGNPGTGKTTVGKTLAKILHAYGVLKSDKFTYLERKDLVGKYVGQTEDKVKKILKEAYGGVIMVDEAYALTIGDNDNKRDFGNRVIEILLNAMVDRKDDTIFIFAGYPDQMNGFLESNPGLRSRIGYVFDFPDYSPDELTEIFKRRIIGMGLCVDDDALDKAKAVMEYFHTMPDFGNGRFVEKVIGRTLERKASRNSRTDLTIIRRRDVPDIKDIGETMFVDISTADIIRTKKDLFRVAVHEIGHAIAMIRAGHIPEKISIITRYDSAGRVEAGQTLANKTENECKDIMIGLLSGKNAEKIIFGEHSTGCSQDYNYTKNIASYMVDVCAMGDIGVTTEEDIKDIIIEADLASMELMEEYKSFIKKVAHELVKKGEMTGKEVAHMM